MEKCPHWLDAFFDGVSNATQITQRLVSDRFFLAALERSVEKALAAYRNPRGMPPAQAAREEVIGTLGTEIGNG
jgi:hypothetical protein